MSEAAALTQHALAVSRRQYLVWRKIIWSSLATHVFNPVLMLFAFGFGLGAVIDQIDGLSYLAFIVPGMMAYSAMFSASFETSVGSFARFNMQRTWDATLATPVRLVELLLGEAIWAAAKATFSAVCVLVVGAAWGGVGSLVGGIVSLPLIFVANLCFAACGLAATAHAKSWEFFSYFFTFWVTPMFIFSGVFFGVDRFPDYLQPVAWILPMTHLIQVVRPLTAGQDIGLLAILGHMTFIVLMAAAAFWLAHRKLRVRLFD